MELRSYPGAGTVNSKASIGNSKEDFLDGAVEAGRWIRSAQRDSAQGRYWLPEPHHPEKATTVSPVNGVYSGSAGIVLFFLQLAKATGDSTYLEDAKTGADYLVGTWPNLSAEKERLPGTNLSFYNGLSGVAFVLTETWKTTGDSRYRQAALLATQALANAAKPSGGVVAWSESPGIIADGSVILYTTLRAGKIFHGGIDDPEAWTEFDGNTESLHPTQGGRPLNIPRTQIPKPDGVLPVLPIDNKQAAHSDQIFVLDGNGEGAGDYLVADRAIQYLRQCKDKPFFIGCGFSKPHSPPTAPQRFFDLYDPAKLQLPPDFAAWPTVPEGFPKAAIRMRNADLFIGRGASEGEAKEVIRAYIASISWVDWNLGRVLSELDNLGLRDNTVVVFVADHGYQLGEKGKWSKAGSLFEGGTRVPLIIHAPGVHGNGRPSLRVVQSLDIYRTITELCNLEVPGQVESKSLVPLLHSPRTAWDHPAYSIWSEDGITVHGTAVRTERWRYAEFGKEAVNGAMLFDVHSDPLELKNLADDPKYQQARHELSELVTNYSYPVKTSA